MKRFSLGTVRYTDAAKKTLSDKGLDGEEFFARHQQADWGAVSELRWKQNDEYLQSGVMLQSQYPLDEDNTVIIETAGDRSHTVVWMESERVFTETDIVDGYDLWANSYDKERNPLIETEEPLVEKILDELVFSSVLDVGTGTGRWSLKLAQRGAQVSAIDPSPKMLAVAKAYAIQQGLPIDFHQLSLADDLPFHSSQFDLIACMLMLSHIDDLTAAFRKFHSLLKPNGRLLFSVFHPDALAIGWRTAFPRPGIRHSLHNANNTRADYIKALAAVKFHVVKFLDIPAHQSPPEYLPLELPQPIHFLNVCMIVLAEKPE